MTANAVSLRDPKVLALSFLIGSSAFAVDGSIPAIPAVSRALNGDINAAQLTVGLYLLGYGLGQLPMGFLADLLGRRRVVLSGMGLFVVTGILAAGSASIEMLLISRFFQGFFGASGAVVSRAIARDITTGRETAQLFAILTGALGTAMMVAPIIGGIAMHLAGWRSTFAASPALGAIGLFLMLRYVPETGRQGNSSHFKDTFLAGVSGFFGNRQPLIGAGLVVAAFCGLITFVTTSSELLIVHNGFSEFSYGLYFSFVAGGYVVGGLLSRRAANKSDLPKLIKALGWIFLCIAVSLVLADQITQSSPYWLLPFFCVFFGCISSTLALGTAYALAPLQETAGMGAAIIGTFQIIAGSCCSVLLATLETPTSATTIAVLFFVGPIVFTIARLVRT